jgi:invasion protein IalB
MRNQYLYLSAVVFALQGLPASGHDAASTMPDRHMLPREAATAASGTPNRLMVAQLPPAAAAAPAAATLPSQRTETINYENWVLTCREFLEGAKKRNCSAAVAVQRTETGQTVFALSVQFNEQGKVTASIQTPTGVAIAPGVELKFEKANARKAAFDSCEPSRCLATLAADPAFIREVSAAGTVTVVMQAADGKPVNFEFPVKGFDKAYSKMTKG